MVLTLDPQARRKGIWGQALPTLKSPRYITKIDDVRFKKKKKKERLWTSVIKTATRNLGTFLTTTTKQTA